MANNKTIYARFFLKKNKIIDESFLEEEIDNLREDLMYWKIFFSVQSMEKAVDIVFTAKPRNSLPDLFNNEKILDSYDIWIRLSDEGGFNDIIGCRSNSVTFPKKSESKSLKEWGYSIRDWNYVKICTYQADQVKLIFNNAQIEYPNTFISKWLGEIICKELKNKEWILNTDIIYLKSSYNNFQSESNIEKIDFYESKFSKTNGEITQVINDFSLLQLKKQFFDKIHDWKLNKSERRLYENLKSIEFVFNEKVVDKVWWNEDESRWEEDVYCFWDNCSDYEYLKYIEKTKEN
jgi:hypothetical protein